MSVELEGLNRAERRRRRRHPAIRSGNLIPYLRECGCYDGPASPLDKTLISIRCADHEDEPGEGVRLKLGEEYVPAPPKLPAMAIPKGRR